ncbi:molybdopterin molybdotransferase MoeA [Alphaproteobacteria bacterium]|nr:molybdopterin molybdotransferase MoeA [Alphaproteobacteria bacterium]
MPHPATIAPDLASARLIAGAKSIAGTELIRLDDADGRINAADIIARNNLPATANAAVDGYAIHTAFLQDNPDYHFEVVGRAAAGHPFNKPIAPGQAVHIFTGAIMPNGPDAVAMHEDCTAFDDAGSDTKVQIHKTLNPGANNRPAGENIAIGETIIPAGKRLGPADLGIAAAAGIAQITVRKRLTIGLLSMGDEIIDAGDENGTGQTSPAAIGQVYDSNRPMLASLLRADGYIVNDYGIIADDLAALTAAYKTALDACDIVISSGGASDGDEDHTQQALHNNDAALVFWRLAMKPGRPMAVGAVGDKRIFCLPGNPVAAFVCYRLIAAPAFFTMAGGITSPIMRVAVRADFDHKKHAGRAEYLRVKLAAGDDGVMAMQLYGRRGAGVLSSLTGADGLVEIPVENIGVSAGDYLTFIPFREAGL